MIHKYLEVVYKKREGVKVDAFYKVTPLGLDVKLARMILDGMIDELGLIKKGYRSIYVITDAGVKAYLADKYNRKVRREEKAG